MCSSNGLFFQGFQLASLILNMCLCVDLILTMKNPFQPAAGRAKWYYFVSSAVPIFIYTVIGASYQATGQSCFNCLDADVQVVRQQTLVGTVVFS
jgi:hypothetical protein